MRLRCQPHFTPTAVVFLIGSEDRVAFAIEDTVASKLRVDLVARSQSRTGDVIQYIDRITGDSVCPRGAITFTGAIRSNVDHRTAHRQVGVFERTYIRFAAIVTAVIIRQIEIFCIRTRHIVSSIRRDRSGVDAGVAIERNKRHRTAEQGSITFRRMAYVSGRVDENRVCSGIAIGAGEDTLIIFLRRHC